MLNLEILSRGVSIDRLQTFCRVVETGSIVNAAEGDPTRQSQYSRQIRQLEEALEKPLFFRQGRSMRLNENGRQLALMTNAYFSALQEFNDSNKAPLLRIGAGESVLEVFVYPRFNEVRTALKDQRFEFRSLSTNEVTRLIGTGELDAGLIREDAKKPTFEAISLGRMEFELFVPRKLLPGREIAALDQIKEIPMAWLAGDGRYARLMPNIFRNAGLRPVIIAQTDSFSKIAALAVSGGLAAIVPTQLASEFPADDFARYRTTDFNDLTREITLVSMDSPIRPELSKNLKRLATILKRAP